VTARALVIGLDGADVDVIAELGAARLPRLHALMARGAWARLRSVLPPATLPNWTTFLTGVDPGAHGVFDFTIRDGDRVRFAGGTVREVPTIASRLDRMGRACLVYGFPATWPPERLAHGIFVSGWDSPVAFEADRSFVWPPEVGDAMRTRFGAMRWDDVDEFGADRPGWHDALPAHLIDRVRRKTAVARLLLSSRPWDLAAIYFGESDTASHHLWAHHDPCSPRHPPRASERAKDGLAAVYAALDAAVGELVQLAGEGVEITIVSDHGSGGASDKVVYLNRALAEAGLLTFLPGRDGARPIARLKDAALGVLGPRAREAIFLAAGRALPGLLESSARFGAIDFARTRVFSDELNYFPAIHVNLRGREPRGIIDRSELGAIRRELELLARALRDPWTGVPIIESIHAREELYAGPYVERAPDFLLELALDRGAYSYNLLPSASAPRGTGPIRRLAPSEHLGRKGRSLPGSHRARGLFVAAGPSVRAAGEIDARIADATATVLARLGVMPGNDLAGRVLREILVRAPRSGEALAAATTSARDRSATGDLARTEERLRALGYVD
jgi:predicted AlkP superfamily phosphohydrolase/phosphomutase